MKNRSRWIKIMVCIFPFIAVSIIYIFKDVLYYLGDLLPACPSYTFLDIYCPGCGNTRSVQHLLKGDVIGSLKFNPVPLFGIVIGVLAYLELFSYVFGKQIKFVPRSRKFWTSTIIVFSIYFILRNFLRI